VVNPPAASTLRQYSQLASVATLMPADLHSAQAVRRPAARKALLL
jgi:hypothetical protein